MYIYLNIICRLREKDNILAHKKTHQQAVET